MTDGTPTLGWIGSHMEGIPAFKAVLEAGYNVEFLVTLPDEERLKRSGHRNHRPIARDHDVEVQETTDVNEKATVEFLSRFDLDLLFVIGWNDILSGEVLSLPNLGAVGAHASLLPRNRGRAPINWSIIKDQDETGNTLFWLEEAVDEGDIIDQRSFPIHTWDTCGTLYEKVAETNREMILDFLEAVEDGELPGRPQPKTDTPKLPGRTPEDGRIDWAESNETIYNLIRAVARPYPGAFSNLRGERWTIWDAALLPGQAPDDADPGEVLGPAWSPTEEACGQVVACGEGLLLVREAADPGGSTWTGTELSELDWEGEVWHD